MKNIITIQHAQSEQHVNGMVGSWTDWELTDLGREHAENIGRKLSAELQGREWRLYSSDLKRAMQTARPLAGYLGIEIETREDLREMYFGEAIGKSKQWARENRLPVNSINDPAYCGAETWRMFWNRIEAACDEIIADEGEKVIVVAHAGTLAVWRQVWLGSATRELEAFDPAGSVTFLRIEENGAHIIDRCCDLSYRS